MAWEGGVGETPLPSPRFSVPSAGWFRVRSGDEPCRSEVWEKRADFHNSGVRSGLCPVACFAGDADKVKMAYGLAGNEGEED